MKNVNTKRKTESDIRIFKDCLPTVGELRNPEDIDRAHLRLSPMQKGTYYVHICDDLQVNQTVS
jgi:hypothetical protein